LGLDLKDPTIPLSSNISFLKADLFAVSEEEVRLWALGVDLVLSDLSPKTCGIKWLDHQRSLDLNRRALELVILLLKKGGAAVLKIFEGEGLKSFIQDMKNNFGKLDIHKPKSSRSESPEIYLIGRKFKRLER
jgi:23S rRNA (uridine2552-2'-O)-methyltransferase